MIAVLEVGDGVFEVLSTSGDTHLGGDDFDKVDFVTSSIAYQNSFLWVSCFKIHITLLSDCEVFCPVIGVAHCGLVGIKFQERWGNWSPQRQASIAKAYRSSWEGQNGIIFVDSNQYKVWCSI